MYNIINIINTVAYYHELRVQNPKILVHKAKKVLFFFYLYCGIHFMIDINETLQTSDQIRSVSQLCLTLCNPMDCSPPGSSCLWDSPGKNTGVGCHALFQGIFPTQESNLGLPQCRQTRYHLSHQGSPQGSPQGRSPREASLKVLAV